MRKGSKKTAVITLSTLAAVVISVTGILIGNGPSEQVATAADQNQVPAPAEEKRAVNVAVEVLDLQNVEETFTLPGTLEAWEDITLSLERPGAIVWVGPREGDHLKAGDEILRIDKEALLAQQASNETDYDIRKKQLERADSLLGEQLISEREHDEVYQAYQSANTKLTETRIALEKSTLVSPIDGILDNLLVDRGEYGNVGSPAAVVVRVDKLKVHVDLPEKDVQYTKTGQKVLVLPAEINVGTEIGRPGVISHVSYLANESTRTYRSTIEIDNSDGFLRPGMIVRVRFVRRSIEGAIVVPLYAVIDRDGQKYVFVVEDNTAVRRQVRLGPIINGKVVIFGGVRQGERLIIKGQQLVADGGPVRVVEE